VGELGREANKEQAIFLLSDRAGKLQESIAYEDGVYSKKCRVKQQNVKQKLKPLARLDLPERYPG